MGVDSGLPDFRGSTGLFKDRKLALTYEEMSNDKWFFEDPAFAWGINYTQLAMYRKTKPHSGFDALLKWMEDLSKPFYVFTSNIDSQFQKAGFPDDRVVTCHGELHWLQCVNYKCKGGGRNPRPEAVWSAECIPDGLDEHIDPATLKFKDVSLLEAKHFRCPHCGELARPNVWFCTDRNHVGWKAEYDKREAYNKWLSKDIYENGKRLVVVECGGGMAIPTVRCEGEDAVENAGEGSMLIRLNPSDCKVPNDRAVGLPFGAAEGLKRLGEAMQRLKKGDSAGQKRSSGQQPGLGIASAAAKAKARKQRRLFRRHHQSSRSTAAEPIATASSLWSCTQVCLSCRWRTLEQQARQKRLENVFSECRCSSIAAQSPIVGCRCERGVSTAKCWWRSGSTTTAGPAGCAGGVQLVRAAAEVARGAASEAASSEVT
eukprot:TRINITY_DN14506_c0_g1_i3.p1 TRINITY_DN14506_c0_g1~~TRINITY_DN14506_c0_g1_i3.p1  ORF type:complete len:499 (+),score=101.05 TRINITY_DN14506_c0_g1_i3:208-1497(+)